MAQPWYPVVDYTACMECGACGDYALPKKLKQFFEGNATKVKICLCEVNYNEC